MALGMKPASTNDEICQLLESLAGQKAPRDLGVPATAIKLLDADGDGLGYSQLNELLLVLGFDRVTHAFFQYLIDGTSSYQPGAAIQSLELLQIGVDRFRRHALLLFGNVKFAVKTLSRDAAELEYWLSTLEPVETTEYERRHRPITELTRIPGEQTYYLGYLIERELKQRLKADPNDQQAQQEEDKRREVVTVGKRNHDAYLASDHLDVYVATSMRERHEFLAVSDMTQAIFSSETLKPLNLRWFDPTQAYCADRIDKGIAEALMLKRAKCTIYFAQEADTLGKDSELATTLAQGKPVIAFIPEVTKGYAGKLLDRLAAPSQREDRAKLILSQIRAFAPSAAWEEKEVQSWIQNPATMNIAAAEQFLENRIRNHYNKRAQTLKESHPLGIQVNLSTGVANGVLVVRGVDDCAELIRRVMTKEMELDLEEREHHTLLVERISGCVYRVMTRDPMLTNTFWNFYLEPSE